MKKAIKAIVACAAAVFAAGACACESEEATIPELDGFEVKQSITAIYGEETGAEQLFVTDANGDIYEVFVKVYDSTGAKIQTDEGNTFFATDEGGYTIVYTIETYDFTVEKRTTVTVVQKGAEE